MAIQKTEQRMNEAQEILEQTHHLLALKSGIKKEEVTRFFQNQKKLLLFVKRQITMNTDVDKIDIVCDLVTFGFIQQTVDFFLKSSRTDLTFYLDKLVTLQTILDRGRQVLDDFYVDFIPTRDLLLQAQRDPSKEENKSKVLMFMDDFSAKIYPKQKKRETRENYLTFDFNKHFTDSMRYYSVASDMSEQIEAATTREDLNLLFSNIIRGLSEKKDESDQWKRFYKLLDVERCVLNIDVMNGRISLYDAKCLMQQTHLLIESLDAQPEQQAITDFFNNTAAFRKNFKYLKLINGIINVAIGIVAGATLGLIAGGAGATVGAIMGSTVGLISAVRGGSRFMLWRRSDILATQSAMAYVDIVACSAQSLVM